MNTDNPFTLRALAYSMIAVALVALAVLLWP